MKVATFASLSGWDKKDIFSNILAQKKRSACASACKLSKLFTTLVVVNELREKDWTYALVLQESRKLKV